VNDGEGEEPIMAARGLYTCTALQALKSSPALMKIIVTSLKSSLSDCGSKVLDPATLGAFRVIAHWHDLASYRANL